MVMAIRPTRRKLGGRRWRGDASGAWVEGKLPRKLGQSGGTMVKGFNCPNRGVAERARQTGAGVHVAVFGANGPLSEAAGNWVWLRDASLKVCRGTGGACKPD